MPGLQGSFAVRNGTVAQSTVANAPPASAERLYLVTMSGLPKFDLLYRALSSMGFYNLTPDRIRDLQNPDAGDLLARDGSNLAAVLENLNRYEPQRAERVLEFLRLVVPGIQRVRTRALGPKETLEFFENPSGEEKGRKFLASSMSDGTLRAMGVIVALFQRAVDGTNVPVVGIEEPEMALHPAAAGILFDCLQESSRTRQVIVTSHSPDLLDRMDIPVESILAVSVEDGRTLIGPVNHASREIVKKRLRTPGELMRINQMEPDWDLIPNPSSLQLRLFK